VPVPVDKHKEADRLQETRQKRRWGCLLTFLVALTALIVFLLVGFFYFLREIPAPSLDEYVLSELNGMVSLRIPKSNRAFQTLAEQFFEPFVAGNSKPSNDRSLKRLFSALGFFFHRTAYVLLAPGDAAQPEQFVTVVIFRRHSRVLRFFLRQPYDALISASERSGAVGSIPVYRNSETELFFAITDREVLLGNSQHMVESLISRRRMSHAPGSNQPGSLFTKYVAALPSSEHLIAGFILNESQTFDRLLDALEELLPEVPIDFQSVRDLSVGAEAPEALSFYADLATADELSLRCAIHTPSAESQAALARVFETEVFPALKESLAGFIPASFETEETGELFKIRLKVQGLENVAREAGRELHRQQFGTKPPA
jgi:hypothetical protein